MSDENIIFDSDEEEDFYNWLNEAKELGMIEKFEYHPEPFYICDGLTIVPVSEQNNKKQKTRCLFRDRIYTADFKIWIKDIQLFNKFTHKTIVLFNENFKYFNDEPIIIVDTKGTFEMHGKDVFSANQKWIWQLYKLYVYKVIPKELFNEAWVPEKSRWTKKTKKLKKPYEKCRLLEDIKKLI